MRLSPGSFLLSLFLSGPLLSGCDIPRFIDRQADRQYERRDGATHKITVEGATLTYRTLGKKGAPLLLIHGFGPNPKIQWTRQLGKLSKRHCLIVPELVYFGDSRPTGDRRVYSLEYQADQIKVLLDSLGIEQTHVLGLSYGGLVTAFFYTKYPELVDKIIISGSPVKYYSLTYADSLARAYGSKSIADFLLPTTGEEMQRMLPAVMYKAPRVKTRWLDDIVQAFYFEQRADKQGLLRYLARNEPFLQSIAFKTDKEVLLLWGAEDRLIPPEIGRRLQQYLGANARLVLIEKAGHTVNGEKSGKFNRVVLDFLEEPKEKKNKKKKNPKKG